MKNFILIISLASIFLSCSCEKSDSPTIIEENAEYKRKFQECQDLSGYYLNVETYQFNGTPEQKKIYLRCMANAEKRK